MQPAYTRSVNSMLCLWSVDIQQGTFYYTLLSDVLITIVSGIPDSTQKSAAQCFNQIADRTRTIRNSPSIVVLKYLGLSVAIWAAVRNY